MLMFVSCSLSVALIVAVRARAGPLWSTILSMLVLLWSSYLVTLYLDGLARFVAARPPEAPYADSLYVVGIIEYRNSLIDFQISILVLVLSLTISVIWRRRE